MNSDEIRQKYLEFFRSKRHKIIPSASLIPKNDAKVLFTTAGMHPLIPYLLGEKHPLGARLCSSQKCLRTDDIDDVGDNTHLTFFEMLGNWSLGDYFKQESIKWSFEFLTKELNFSLDKIAVSVFQGDNANNIPRDDESANLWKLLGVSDKRIAYLGYKDNWWGPAGQTGPCGPDTEIFYYVGKDNAPAEFNPNDENWVEIWNNVFMEYNKTEQGGYAVLKQKNVDTGMGLERISAILQGKDNVFSTDLFLPIINKIELLSNKEYQDSKKEFRIISDHIKASVFVLSEKISPSNLGQGYILRRLIRRAIRFGKIIGIKENSFKDLAVEVMKIYKNAYPELINNKDFILMELNKETEKFARTLEKGLNKFNQMAEQREITGKDAFNLYQTYGFPIEMTRELAKAKGIEVDIKEFEKNMREHQKISQTAEKGKFKSGLADNSKQTIKYHTVTHLLLAGLRAVLGEQIGQRGANITDERVRFDFSFNRKLTDKEVKEVENWINDKINRNLVVRSEEMSLEKAKEQGAVACFEERYPDIVKVYTIYDEKTGQEFSKEICSGPHIKNTGELGQFKIIKQKASSSGVRRIKAILLDKK